MSWLDLDLIFVDLAVVTCTYTIVFGLYLRNHKYRKLILGRDIGWGV